MRHDTRLHAAPLADFNELRVANVITAQPCRDELRNHERRLSTARNLEHRFVGLFHRIENRGPQASFFRALLAEHAAQRLHGRVRRLAAGRRAADAVGNREHERILAYLNDGRCIFVRRPRSTSRQ